MDSDTTNMLVTSGQATNGGSKDLTRLYRVTIYESDMHAQYPLNFMNVSQISSSAKCVFQ